MANDGLNLKDLGLPTEDCNALQNLYGVLTAEDFVKLASLSFTLLEDFPEIFDVVSAALGVEKIRQLQINSALLAE